MADPTLPKVPRTIVLVGLMGAGKSYVGRRLAKRLGLAFVDADEQIEAAAGCSISDYFARFGEAAFREGERRVIERLLDREVHVLATGGGAFMDPATRSLIREKGISVWLRADLDVLEKRVSHRPGSRPLLAAESPREVLSRLIETRYPVYAEADITVDSGRESPDRTVRRVIGALQNHIDARNRAPNRKEAGPPA